MLHENWPSLASTSNWLQSHVYDSSALGLHTSGGRMDCRRRLPGSSATHTPPRLEASLSTQCSPSEQPRIPISALLEVGSHSSKDDSTFFRTIFFRRWVNQSFRSTTFSNRLLGTSCRNSDFTVAGTIRRRRACPFDRWSPWFPRASSWGSVWAKIPAAKTNFMVNQFATI